MNALYAMLIAAGIGQMQCKPIPEMTLISSCRHYMSICMDKCADVSDDEYAQCMRICLRRYNCSLEFGRHASSGNNR